MRKSQAGESGRERGEKFLLATERSDGKIGEGWKEGKEGNERETSAEGRLYYVFSAQKVLRESEKSEDEKEIER